MWAGVTVAQDSFQAGRCLQMCRVEHRRRKKFIGSFTDRWEQLTGLIMFFDFLSSVKAMKSTWELIHTQGTQFFRGCYHARWVEVFVEDENACKTFWVFHDSKIRGRGSAISRPSWDFQDREWSLRLIRRRINSLTLSCFYIFAICSLLSLRQARKSKGDSCVKSI